MAANRITKNEVHGVSQGTTKGVDAAKTGIVAEASADEINRAAQEKATHSQAKADFVSMPLDALNSAGAWLDKGFTNLAGYIDASWAGEWVGSAAEWVTQKECAAYNYCINGLQEFLPNSDVERILDGSGLILMGGFKMAGGAFLTFAGALTSYTGIGLGGMAAGTVTGVSGISDIEQGINEIKLGLRNDSTTRTGNYVRDTLYDGNDTIYHLSTGTAAMVGMALRPYVMPQKNPVLAGGKQKNIAEKVAMGADDATGLVKEGLGSVSGREYTVTQTGINNVRNYLMEQGFINDYENAAMLERLEQALANGEKITGADAVYYLHELKEAQLVASGINQNIAHEMALQYYKVSPYSVYHPDVINMQPKWWNDAWFDFWEIER